MDEVQYSRVPFVIRLLEVGNEFRRIFEIGPGFLGAVVVLENTNQSQSLQRETVSCPITYRMRKGKCDPV